MKPSKKIFDGLLVLEYRKGNKQALNMLVKRHQMDLFRYALWYTKDQVAAGDIVQDSWTTILGKLNALKDPNSFKSWALRIVLRKAQDHYKKQSRQRKFVAEYSPGPEMDSDQENGTEDRILLLKNAIKELSTEHQMVIRLFYTEQYSLNEISTILDLSMGTVKSRLYHAREKLKSLINNRSHEKRNGKN